MFYVFHGSEEFLRAEEIARFKNEILKDGMGDLNLIVLDGRRVDVRDLMDHCSAIPFLTQRRLVIVEDLLQRLERRRGGDDDAPPADSEETARLVEYLPTMPETTRLVFSESKQLGKRNPVLRLAEASEQGVAKAFEPLTGGSLQNWIRRRAEDKGTAIEPQAVSLLGTYESSDLRRLDGELEKLAAYAGYARAITAEDVRELVAPDLQDDVFKLMDTIGERKGREALRRLREALDNEQNHPLYLLTMMARQVRLILGAKDLAQQNRSPEDIRRELHVSRLFIVNKLLDQARQFSVEDLEAMQRRVLETDQAIKTGRIDAPLALELLVLDICRRRRPARRAPSRARSRSG